MGALVGCNQDGGPNDPVVDAGQLNQDRANMLTDEERNMIKVPSDRAGGDEQTSGVGAGAAAGRNR
ncbi:MAG: hypothetical protein ACK4XJ_02660 [Fimbriimonadaceae bacterium]